MNKTNLDIIDPELWNWIKDIKNKFEIKTISELVFRIINNYQSYNIEKSIFLSNMEKFLEFEHYSIKNLRQDLGFNINIIATLTDKYIDSKISLEKPLNQEERSKYIRLVHEKMIQNKIIPQEITMSFNIKKYLDSNKLDFDTLNNYVKIIKSQNSDAKSENSYKLNIDNKEILEILLPNIEDRKREIYFESVRFANEIIENGLDCKKCLNCAKNCYLKKPDYIYFKAGIPKSLEDIQADLVFDILKAKYSENTLLYYGIVLIISINLIIQRQLSLIKDFISSELYLFDKTKDQNIINYLSIIFIFNSIENISETDGKEEIKRFIERKIPNIFLF